MLNRALPVLLALALLVSSLTIPLVSGRPRAEEFNVSEGFIWWNGVWWAIPRHITLYASSRGQERRFYDWVTDKLLVLNETETPYSRLAWLAADLSFDCGDVRVLVRVEGISNFRLCATVFIRLNASAGWNITRLITYSVTNLRLTSFYVPHVANVSFSPTLPTERIHVINETLCALMSDNFILSKDPEGGAWIFGFTKRPDFVEARPWEYFFGWPNFFFSYDINGRSELVLNICIFNLGKVSWPAERLIRAASDLAHETLYICDCVIHARERKYDCWLTELRYKFALLENDFGIDVLTTPPHNSELELVNDTCSIAIYLPEEAVAYHKAGFSSYFLSSGEFAMGLYFNDSAAGPRGRRDCWLGDRSIGGGFYAKKGYKPGDVIVVLCATPAEKLIPSMFLTDITPYVSEEYMRTALIMCVISVLLLASSLTVVLLVFKRWVRPELEEHVTSVWGVFVVLTLALGSLFLWAYGYNLLKLHNLALSNLFFSSALLSAPVPFRKEKRLHQVMLSVLPLLPLSLVGCWWLSFVNESSAMADYYLLFIQFLLPLLCASPSLVGALLSDKMALLVSLMAAVIGTVVFYAANVPRLFYGVEVSLDYAGFLATALFFSSLLSYRLAAGNRSTNHS